MRGLVLTLLCAATSTGCGAASPCVEHSLCSPGICRADGTCGPLADETVHSRTLRAIDWGVAAAEESAGALVVGGPDDAVSYLAFGPLPTHPRGRVLLHLRPDLSSAPPEATVVVEAEATERFRGAALSSARRPRRRGAVALGRVPPTQPRLLTLDLTAAATVAWSRDERVLYLRISQTRGPTTVPLRFASPDAEVPFRRPLLTLLSR